MKTKKEKHADYMRGYSQRQRLLDGEKWSRAQRERHIKHRYGISVSDYDDLFESQGGRCAICREPCTSGRRLAIDHDHETDHVRGLLCARCNRGIGLLRDDPELLRVAADYIDGRVELI